MTKYNEHNQEIPDNTPVALPVGYEAPETLAETIQRMVKNNEYLKHFEGKESEEEANDFELEEEDDIHFISKHEFTEMHEEYINLEDENLEQPKEKPLEESKIEETPVDETTESTVQ